MTHASEESDNQGEVARYLRYFPDGPPMAVVDITHEGFKVCWQEDGNSIMRDVVLFREVHIGAFAWCDAVGDRAPVQIGLVHEGSRVRFAGVDWIVGTDTLDNHIQITSEEREEKLFPSTPVLVLTPVRPSSSTEHMESRKSVER